MLADHDALLRDWHQNADRRENVNTRFLRRLKLVDDPENIDVVARAVHAQVFSRIDSTR